MMTEFVKDIKFVCLVWDIISYIFPGINERDLYAVKELIKTGDTIFDIGANIGSYTYTLSKLAGKSGIVIACEPIDSNIRKLKYVIKKLRLDNVCLEPVALSNTNGTCSMIIPLVNGKQKNTRAYIDLENCNATIKQTTLMDLFIAHNLQTINFIKCDVEGAERLVFEGGSELIKKYRPTILCELSESMSTRFNTDVNEVFEYIKELGNYTVYVVKRGEKSLTKVSQINNDYINYFFISDRNYEYKN